MFKSLQTRLLALLIAFSVLPALLLGGSVGLFAANTSRQRVQDTLNAIITLKQSQVDTWLTGLQDELNSVIERDAPAGRLAILLTQPPDSPAFAAAYQEQLGLFNTELTARRDFEEILLMDATGLIVLSTRPDQEGNVQASRDIHRLGIQGKFVGSPAFDVTLEQIAVQLAQPVPAANGATLGVLAARVNLAQLNQIMLERTGIGQTGETYLVAKNYTLLTQPRLPQLRVGEDYVRTFAVERALVAEASGSSTYTNYAGVPVLGAYRYLPGLQIALLAEQAQTEAFASANLITNLTIAALILAVTVATLAAYQASAGLVQPLVALTRSAQAIAADPHAAAADPQQSDQSTGISQSLAAATRRPDEIGSLAQAFQAMFNELRALIHNLEARVDERTRQLTTRSEQLQAAAEVSRSATTMHERDRLIQQVVELIQQRFDLYYVGLFLVDDLREWAVLKAGTGQAGQAMLGRGHRLSITAASTAEPGQQQGERPAAPARSMIGWCIENAQARIALQAGEDPVRLATPDLPETRSEAAIPLRSRGQVLGAISVQSRQPAAFDPETIAVFQTMADQVAIAIDNTRLLAESQKALDSIQQAYGRLSHQAWLQRLKAEPLAFRKDARGLARLEARHPAPSAQDGSLSIPIRTRGQTIGVIQLEKTPTQAGPARWTPEEAALLETIADQLGATLDAARLFQETQQQAERERLVGEITTNMRATLDIDNVLQTAARELLNALDLAEVEVRITEGRPVSAGGERPGDGQPGKEKP